MKKIFNYRILAFLFIATILYAACTKETANTRLPAQVSTSQYKNIKADSVTVVGFIVAAGSGFTEQGVCYNTSSGPTTSNNKIAFTGPTTGATYTVKIGGLAYATVYYARAYAINAIGTLYGEEVTFTTLPVLPTINTSPIASITGSAGAGGGNVTVGGGAPITARGIAYGTAHSPVISGTKTSDGTGTGAFISALTGLKGNTTYYVRAYATNSVGTAYGPEVNFTTLVDMPVVTTTAVTAVTKITATSGGAVTYDGGGTITARGLAIGASANPTITGTVVAGGTGTGTFVSNIAGLTKYTAYHVRAYATNSAGTAYGSDVAFTTLSDIITYYLPGDYISASYPGSTFNNWDPANSPIVKSTISAGDKLEGYVYMAGVTNNWKFASKPSWDGPNYANNNGAGTLEPGILDATAANNITSAAGYYKINANATAMTYTQVATTWGIMGDYNNWASQTNMIYNPTSQTFSLALHLTSGGGFKFRGTSDWSVNFGNTAGDGTTLDYGAANNIPVTTTADYALTLDLSHPNAYTYSANFWGLIGDATPGNWSADTPMTWDPVHNVFTATLALTANGNSFKIRANGAWTLAYGGTLSALTTAGGAPNLSVPTAGNYTITFDPWKVIATATKN